LIWCLEVNLKSNYNPLFLFLKSLDVLSLQVNVCFFRVVNSFFYFAKGFNFVVCFVIGPKFIYVFCERIETNFYVL
jgi:hypothetical protein